MRVIEYLKPKIWGISVKRQQNSICRTPRRFDWPSRFVMHRVVTVGLELPQGYQLSQQGYDAVSNEGVSLYGASASGCLDFK